MIDLLTEQLSMQDFANSLEIRSENGIMLTELVEHLARNDPTEIPKVYHTFISNVAKATSVAGLIQPTNSKALDYLEAFVNFSQIASGCNPEESTVSPIDLLHLDNIEKLKLVIRELPVLWEILSNIMKYEVSGNLGADISKIVQRLLKIRRETFLNVTDRDPYSYFPWKSENDHPTQFCPAFPLVKHPRKYNVYNKKDCEFCAKDFTSHKDFSPGLFSYGCACSYNITYGYEMMLCKESAHNLFRFLTCRDIDLNQLDGVLFDFACGAHRYALNREPALFEYVRFLVDGSHWQVIKTSNA